MSVSTPQNRKPTAGRPSRTQSRQHTPSALQLRCLHLGGTWPEPRNWNELPQVSANKSSVVKSGSAAMVVAKDTAGVPIIGAKVTAGNTSTTTASAASTPCPGYHPTLKRLISSGCLDGDVCYCQAMKPEAARHRPCSCLDDRRDRTMLCDVAHVSIQEACVRIRTCMRLRSVLVRADRQGRRHGAHDRRRHGGQHGHHARRQRVGEPQLPPKERPSSALTEHGLPWQPSVRCVGNNWLVVMWHVLNAVCGHWFRHNTAGYTYVHHTALQQAASEAGRARRATCRHHRLRSTRRRRPVSRASHHRVVPPGSQ